MSSRKLTTADVQGRDVLHRNTSYIVSTMLAEFNKATDNEDTRTIIEIASILLPYTMPKLQAVAHISQNTAIDFLRELRQELLATRTALPAAPPIEAEYRELKAAEAPPEAPAIAPIPNQDKQGKASEQGVCSASLSPAPDSPKTAQDREAKRVGAIKAAPAVAPQVDGKPFSEMTRDEIAKRYKVG